MDSAFDPWTATREAAEAAERAHVAQHGPVRHRSSSPWERWSAAQRIDTEIKRRAASIGLGGGFHGEVLDAIALCMRFGLEPPSWLRAAFVQLHAQVRVFELSSWDQAFGPPNPAHKSLKQLQVERRKVQIFDALIEFFEGPNPPPRTRIGFAKAAARFGITARQVEEWLPKTRQNTRASARRSAGLPRGANAAHDPFNVLSNPDPEAD